MSLKPLKKSDMDKNWMKRRQDRKIMIQPEYHLIVTEGTKTEPQYFQTIKDIINQKYRRRIQLDIYGEGDNTIGLFEKARNRAVGNRAVIYKHVWVVYDTDDFPAEHINKTVELCDTESNEETIYHAIWSNQCIELWYLLHFCYFQSDIAREGYWSKLSDWMKSYGIGEYQKNRQDMFQVLRPYMDMAIVNARRLSEINGGRAPASAAPGTKVYELIEMLIPYLRESE